MVVTIEVEYAVESEREARKLAHRDAEHIFQQGDVLSVYTDIKRTESDFPITRAYLAEMSHEPPGGPQNGSQRVSGVVKRVSAYVPGQMSVDECIAEALSDSR